MPRYLLVTADGDALDEAVHLAAHRFPEVAVEPVAVTSASPQGGWFVRAPSEAHVIRWAEAARLAVGRIQRLVTTDMAIDNTKEHLE